MAIVPITPGFDPLWIQGPLPLVPSAGGHPQAADATSDPAPPGFEPLWLEAALALDASQLPLPSTEDAIPNHQTYAHNADAALSQSQRLGLVVLKAEAPRDPQTPPKAEVMAEVKATTGKEATPPRAQAADRVRVLPEPLDLEPPQAAEVPDPVEAVPSQDPEGGPMLLQRVYQSQPAFHRIAGPGLDTLREPEVLDIPHVMATGAMLPTSEFANPKPFPPSTYTLNPATPEALAAHLARTAQATGRVPLVQRIVSGTHQVLVGLAMDFSV